jgi:hypothetical protein
MAKWFFAAIFCIVFFQSSAAATFAAARFELTPLTGEIQTSGTSVVVRVNTDGAVLKSATAVLSYDHTKVSVTSVQGTFFPTVTIDTTTQGEVVISGTLPIGDTTGVTGTGTLATLTVQPLAGATGTVSMSFRCSESSSDDSNLISLEGTNLLSTTVQCANNSTGSYTLAAASSSDNTTTAGGTDSASVTPGSRICNQTCTAARDCSSGLSCVSGLCRNPQCSTTTNCSCAGAAIAAAQGDTVLPESGSVDSTTLILATGLFFLLGGALLIFNERTRQADHSKISSEE